MMAYSRSKSSNSSSQDYHHGNSVEITDINPPYTTGLISHSCETPFTMGLQKNKTPIERAQDKPTSLRLAINAKCYECIGCGFDPKPTNAIRNCVLVDCSLWPVRPYQKIKTPSIRKKENPLIKKPVTTLASGTGFDLSLQQNHEVKPL